MNSGVASFMAVFLCSGIVFSITDLNDPIQYIDRAQSSFIGINANKYRMGTAMDAVKDASEDMSQFSGKIEDCSIRGYWCKAIAFLKFVIPKSPTSATNYEAGAQISIKHLEGGGWHGSATCWRLMSSGCENRVNGSGPMVTYEYDVNSAGILTAVQIKYWDSHGALADHENLQLSTALGLGLK